MDLHIYVCIFLLAFIIQALSGDFQQARGKMHMQILLGMRWCAMCIFLFLKLYSFIKGIMPIYIVFFKNLRQVF